MPHPPGNIVSTQAREKAPFDQRQLSTLVAMESPEAVHDEVLHILNLIDPDFATQPVSRAFWFTVNLYNGQLQGYRACNTDYHNLRHITDTYLAMMRLLHGALLSGADFNHRQILLGLTGALLHDAGMIQKSTDTEGTGAKYTQEHVQLSMDFVAAHTETFQLQPQETADLRTIILCTDLMADIQTIRFSSPVIELLGKILATADLIAQMADRTYLEKLLFLYHEFQEADMGSFANELDFLQQTRNFYAISAKRFQETLDNARRYMVPHFKARWGIHEDLYTLSLENQRIFLEKLLADGNRSIYQELQRSHLIEKLRRKFGNTRQNR